MVENVEYREASTSACMPRRVPSDRLIPDVSTHHDSVSGQTPGTLNMQRMVTTVAGRRGERIGLVRLTRTQARATRCFQAGAALGRRTAAGY